jgi:hypothetical protein
LPQLPLFPLLPVGFQFDNLFRVSDQEQFEPRADTLEWFAQTETFKALYGDGGPVKNESADSGDAATGRDA